jgi:hypothetical protein
LDAQPFRANRIWGIRATHDELTGLGQSPGRSPTVFGFTVPNYSPPGTAISANNLVAPEFQMVDEVTVVGIVNFFTGILTNGPRDMTLIMDHFSAAADDPDELIRRVDLAMAYGTLSVRTKALMKEALQQMPGGAGNALQRARAAFLMTLASPDYLIQK